MRRLLLTLALLAFIIVPIPAHAQGQEDCFGVHATLTPADGFTNANGDFEIDGTADADVIVGSDPGDANNPSGNDVIFGNGGDDTICAGDGVDMVSGNGGADTISLGPGGQTDAIRACADPVNAEVGTGGPGTDYLEGNGGDDCIRGGPDNDALLGGYGSDDVRGNDGDDFVQGGPGDDNLRDNFGSDNLQGDDGADTWQACDDSTPDDAIDAIETITDPNPNFC